MAAVQGAEPGGLGRAGSPRTRVKREHSDAASSYKSKKPRPSQVGFPGKDQSRSQHTLAVPEKDFRAREIQQLVL